MPYLIATDKPLYWTAQASGQTYISDIAEIGGKIGIPPTYTAISDTDENAYLGKVVGMGGTYNPIPSVGEWCEGGIIYSYNGNLVICRQDHYRVNFAPESTPNLWSVYRAGGGVLDWIANEPVMVGTHRMYGGIENVCIQAHTTALL